MTRRLTRKSWIGLGIVLVLVGSTCVLARWRTGVRHMTGGEQYVILFDPDRVPTKEEVRALSAGDPPLPGFVRVQLERPDNRWSWRGLRELALTVEGRSRELESVRLYCSGELVATSSIEETGDRARAVITFQAPLIGRARYRFEVRTTTFAKSHDFRVSGMLGDPLEELRRVFGAR